MPETPASPDEQLRGSIASKVLVYGTIILGIVAITLIVSAFAIDKGNAINIVSGVFNSLLPVIATWVGTVIAFYFGKENFEAASRQINNLVSKITPEQFKSVPVKQVMIDFDTMMKYCNGDATTLKLQDLDNDFTNNSDKSRMPIVDKDCQPLFIMHKEEYNNVIKDEANKSKLIKDFKQYGFEEPKGFVIIPETATLNDAQQAIKKIATVQDVFVTKSGSANEPLLGWLTDSRILNFLQ